MHSLCKEPLRPKNGNPVHEFGVYSKLARLAQDNISGIIHRVDAMNLEESNATTAIASTSGPKLTYLTQGDKLNQIKARRTVRATNCATVNNSSRSTRIVQYVFNFFFNLQFKIYNSKFQFYTILFDFKFPFLRFTILHYLLN